MRCGAMTENTPQTASNSQKNGSCFSPCQNGGWMA